jgi:hypothetical protein
MMTWSCENCTLLNDGNLEFEFSDPRVFAHFLDWRVSSSSYLPGNDNVIFSRMFAVNSTHVFRYVIMLPLVRTLYHLILPEAPHQLSWSLICFVQSLLTHEGTHSKNPIGSK